MAELLWLPEAQQDIVRLYELLHEKSPTAAQKMINTLLKGADHLQTFPEMGKPMEDELQRRELFVPFGAGAYVLRYKLSGDQVVIIRVWHSRESR